MERQLIENNLDCYLVRKHNRRFVLLSDWVVDYFMDNFDAMMKIYRSEKCAVRTWYYWQEKDEILVTVATWGKIVKLFQTEPLIFGGGK